jgi:hypothetical protein
MGASDTPLAWQLRGNRPRLLYHLADDGTPMEGRAKMAAERQTAEQKVRAPAGENRPANLDEGIASICVPVVEFSLLRGSPSDQQLSMSASEISTDHWRSGDPQPRLRRCLNPGMPTPAARSMPHETKATGIIRLAPDGVEYREIATTVGSTCRTVRTVVSSARKSGTDIPSSLASKQPARLIGGPMSNPDIATPTAAGELI